MTRIKIIIILLFIFSPRLYSENIIRLNNAEVFKPLKKMKV